MKKPHKHAEMIKAWADGAEVEWKYHANAEWQLCETPCWREQVEYRIKPEPDVVHYAKATLVEGYFHIKAMLSHEFDAQYDNLKLTFDGDTKKLKSAEVIK